MPMRGGGSHRCEGCRPGRFRMWNILYGFQWELSKINRKANPARSQTTAEGISHRLHHIRFKQ